MLLSMCFPLILKEQLLDESHGIVWVLNAVSNRSRVTVDLIIIATLLTCKQQDPVEIKMIGFTL